MLFLAFASGGLVGVGVQKTLLGTKSNGGYQMVAPANPSSQTEAETPLVAVER
jgi:hypothetical protein